MSSIRKTAVITGAGAGIGMTAGRAFADSGTRVVLVDIDGDSVVKVAAQIMEQGGEAVGLGVDVANADEVARMVDDIMIRFGRIDTLYNNAGGPLAADGDITEIDVDGWEAAFRVDLFGTILCSRSVIPHMRAAGSGTIINTSSMVAIRGIAGRDAYVAAKGAIVSLTRSMAAEFGHMGVTVNAIAPGITRSERVIRALQEDARTKALVDRHVVGLVDPEDIAAVAVFLASDGARKITGQVLSVDSGATQILTTLR